MLHHASGYDFFKSVAKGPTNRELRKAWFKMPKYGKSLPKHGYAPKWMPVVDGRGQDVEVDPYDRIAKRGVYTDMVEGWNSWYKLDNLVAARGAPGGLKIAQDLRSRGISLNDYNTSILLWDAVNSVQSAVKNNESDMRGLLSDAVQLLSVLSTSHTIGLETGAAVATLYGLGNRLETLQTLETSLKHLVEDPEEPVRAKRDFYEALSIAPLLHDHETPEEYNIKTSLSSRFQSEMMKVLHLRPTQKYWEAMLYRARRANDHVRVLEHFENMDAVTEKSPKHYFQVMQSCATRGDASAVTNLMLDMKHQKVPLYSSTFTWSRLLEAYAKKKDLVGLVSAWERVRKVKVASWAFGAKRIKYKFKPNAAVVARVVQCYIENGKALEGYHWWRREALLWSATLKENVSFSHKVLIPMTKGLLSEGRYNEVAEIYDEVKNRALRRRVLVGMKLKLSTGRDTTKKLAVTDPEIWRLLSIGLASSTPKRLQESHFAVMKMLTSRNQVQGSSTGAECLHLLESCVDEGDDQLLASSVKMLSRYRVPLSGGGYSAVIRHQLLTDDPGVMATVAELASQGTAIPSESFHKLISSAVECGGNDILIKAVWSVAIHPKRFTVTHETCALLVKLLGLSKAIKLKNFSDTMLRCVEGFADYTEGPQQRSRVAPRRGKVYVADGTVGLHLDRLEEGSVVLVPQTVLSQLQGVVEGGVGASVKEVEFFKESLEVLREALSGGDGGVHVKLISLSQEAQLGIPDPTPAPLRVLETARALDATLLTNDVELATRSLQTGHRVKTLHSRTHTALAASSPALLEE